MPELLPHHKTRRHREHRAHTDVRKQWHHMYNARWRRYRLEFLQENPLCVCADCEGKTTPATVVDHIVDHRGNYELFWNADNHQALAKRCHDRKTGRTVQARNSSNTYDNI